MSMAVHGVHIPTATEELQPEAGERLTRPFARFAALSSAGGIMLILCTLGAMFWANSQWSDAYHYIFHDLPLAIGLLPDTALTTGVDGKIVSQAGHVKNLHWWINDLLMAIFFLLVGLEIKREILVGELSNIKKATLPVFAAIGGMVAPAGIYMIFNAPGSETFRGWGVPMATDIAFALGILALLGSRAPVSLKIFLTSLAIADDLGALMVIAIFYTEKLQMIYLGYSAAIIAGLFVLNFMGFRRAIWYLIPGVFLWYFVYASGVHATIAGVLLAATIPASSRVDSKRYLSYSRAALDAFEDHSRPGTDVKTNSEQRAAVYAISKNNHFVMPLLHRMESAIHPWAAFAIIPIFALANAGVHIGSEFTSGGVGGFVSTIAADPIMIGIILGLFVGKPVGIVLFSWLSVKLRLAELPKGVSWRHILGAGCLAGIGFTMALFIANLAFKTPYGADEAAAALALKHREHATISILLASLLSTILGLGLLMTCRPKPEPEPDSLGPSIDTH